MSARQTKKLPNYYEVLNVGSDATAAEVKDAFRRLALELHPDVNDDPADHERFRLANEAYRVLSDPTQRKTYDTMRLLDLGLPIGRLKEWIDDPIRMQGALNKIATVLAVASGLFRPKAGRDGRDLTIPASIGHADSYAGCERAFDYGREADCDACKGTGFESISTCAHCDGVGRLRSDYFPLVAKRCPRCETRGWIGETRCAACEGKGRVTGAHRVKVRMPAGVTDGYRLRVTGHGEAGSRGGKDGDLIVLVSVESRSDGRRQGNDWTVDHEVDFATAALGGVTHVPLPVGSLALRIPAGSWEGRRLRAPGRGFPDVRGGDAGDVFVTLRIRPVESPDATRRELIDEYLRTVRSESTAPTGVFRGELERHFGAR